MLLLEVLPLLLLCLLLLIRCTWKQGKTLFLEIFNGQPHMCCCSWFPRHVQTDLQLAHVLKQAGHLQVAA